MSSSPSSGPSGRLPRSWRAFVAARRERAAARGADRGTREQRSAEEALAIFGQRLDAARIRLRASIAPPGEGEEPDAQPSSGPAQPSSGPAPPSSGAAPPSSGATPPSGAAAPPPSGAEAPPPSGGAAPPPSGAEAPPSAGN
ncbi:MAG: hypothetical protein ACLP01_15760 [Solirubrobacteraceae bacterium]